MFGSRFLKRRSVLAVIFVCSLLYFVTSIYKQSQSVGRITDSTEIPRKFSLADFNWLIRSVNVTDNCENSVQGRDILVDDKGYVCPHDSLMPTGCCANNSKRYVCDSCQRNGCCAVYEHCVSCCLQPEKLPVLKRIVLRTSSSFHNLFSSVTNLFQFCLAKCRTSSLSVVHENSYRNSVAKHCYADRIPDIQLPA